MSTPGPCPYGAHSFCEWHRGSCGDHNWPQLAPPTARMIRSDERIEALARVYDPDAFRDDVWAVGEADEQAERKEAALAWATWNVRHPEALLAALGVAQ